MQVLRIPHSLRPNSLTESRRDGILQVMYRSGWQTIGFLIFASLLFGLLTLPAWRWLWGEWMNNQYYSHGLLIPLIAVFLAIQRIRHNRTILQQSVQSTVDNRNIGGLLLLGASLALFLWFVNDRVWYLAAFATIGLLSGLIWVFGGSNLLKHLLFPVGYLCLMIPLPFVERATLPLALFTGVCSGALVQLLGMEISIVGNAVNLPGTNLVIGAQCSGINSLITLISLMTLTVYLVEGKLWSKIILVLVAVPLAMLGNILRVMSLLLVAGAYGADTAFMFYHDYSGILFFLLALVLLYPLAQLLRLSQLRLDVI